MKRIVGYLLLVILLVGCGPAPDSAIETQALPTHAPTATSSISRDGTPMPEGGAILSPSNVEEIEEFARWGAGWLEDTALSADGNVLYVQRSLSVTAYDSTTKEELWKFAPEEGVGSMAIHEGNGQVAVGGTSGSLWVLDLTLGEVIYEWRADTERTVVLAFSEEGDWLASGSEYGTAKVRHLPDGLLVFEMDELDFSSALFADLGRNDSGIAVAQNRLVATDRVFDLETGDLVFSEGNILAVFGDTGLVATDLGSFVALQRLEDGEQVASYDVRIPEEEMDDAGAVITSAVLSEDYTKLAIGFFRERRVLVFDVESGERLQNLFISVEVRPIPETLCYGVVEIESMDFSDTGNELVVSNNFDEFDTWDLNTGALLASTTSTLEEDLNPPDSGTNDDPIRFSPDGMWMASGSNLWNIETGTYQIFSRETVIGFTGDQRYVYTSSFIEGKVKKYSLDDFQLQQEVLISSEPSYGCNFYGQAVSPEGLYFEVTGFGGDVVVWDLDNGVELPNEWISSFYPDEIFLAAEKNWLVVEAYGGEVAIIDSTTQEQLWNFDIEEQVEEAAISANGETLAVAGWDEFVYVWDLNEAEPSRLDLDSGGHWLPFMEEVAVSADGNLVAADCTDTLLIWDAHSGEILYRFLFGDEEDIFDTIYDLAFSPDGRYLAILMSDGSIRLWGVHS